MLEIFGKRLETTVLELTLKSTWLKACGYFGLSSPSLATYSKGLGPPRIFVLPTYLLTNQFAMMKQHKFLPHLPFCWFLGIGFFSHETIYHLSLCVQCNAWAWLGGAGRSGLGYCFILLSCSGDVRQRRGKLRASNGFMLITLFIQICCRHLCYRHPHRA